MDKLNQCEKNRPRFVATWLMTQGIHKAKKFSLTANSAAKVEFEDNTWTILPKDVYKLSPDDIEGE